jgi:hypothetical protein
MNDFETCEFCRTEIEWEGRDSQKGIIWYCEKCNKYFCFQCFVDKHGEEEFYKMLHGDDVLCPECYGQ